ncbi:MAG: hypothetical protein WAX77_08980 [Methylococcaceae bacterium]
MPFTQFKNIPQVQQQYAIKYREQNFIEPIAFEVSPYFLAELQFNLINLDVFASEAARCEIIIFPLLREVYKYYADYFALWIQKSIYFDAHLSGVPDYVISKKSSYGKLYLEMPLVAIVEAKKNDFELGWGQCLAELVAAQKLNANNSLAVYGIVTDGKTWEFAYLVDDVFIKNTKSYSLDNLSELLAGLNFIFNRIKRLINS